jgi:hypothetical protein
MALNDTQAVFYTEMENMFDTPGWAHLIKGWQQELDNLPQAMFFNAKTAEDILTARTRYGVLSELVGLAATLREQRRQLEEGEPVE